MAQSNLDYILTVKLSELRELEKLHDTIKAIQDLSNKGADFDLRVNTSSLEALSVSIGKAVASGVSRGRARVDFQRRDEGTRETSGAGGNLERMVGELVSALRTRGVAGDPPLGGQSSSSRPRKLSLRPAYENALSEYEAAVKDLDAVIEGRVKFTRDIGNRVVRVLGEKYRRKQSKIESEINLLADSPGGTSSREYAELQKLYMELADPKRIRQTIQNKISTLRSMLQRSGAASAGHAGSIGGSGASGAALNVAVDAKALENAFKTSAQTMAATFQTAMQTAAKDIGKTIADIVQSRLSSGPPIREGLPVEVEQVLPNVRRGPEGTYGNRNTTLMAAREKLIVDLDYQEKAIIEAQGKIQRVARRLAEARENAPARPEVVLSESVAVVPYREQLKQALPPLMDVSEMRPRSRTTLLEQSRKINRELQERYDNLVSQLDQEPLPTGKFAGQSLAQLATGSAEERAYVSRMAREAKDPVWRRRAEQAESFDYGEVKSLKRSVSERDEFIKWLESQPETLTSVTAEQKHAFWAARAKARRQDGSDKPVAEGNPFTEVENLERELNNVRVAHKGMLERQAAMQKELATVAAQMATQGIGDPTPHNLLSARQALALQASIGKDPYSHAAYAARVGATYYGNLPGDQQRLFADAAGRNVMAMFGGPVANQLVTRRVTDDVTVTDAESRIAELMRAQATTADLYSAETDPEKRAALGLRGRTITEQLDLAMATKQENITALLNKQVDASITQLRATLSEQLARAMSDPEATPKSVEAANTTYNNTIARLNRESMQRDLLASDDPNIKRTALLIPQVLAQYVRDTLTRYQEALRDYLSSGKTIDPVLLKDIASNNLLSSVIRGAPQSSGQAREDLHRLSEFKNQFDRAKNAFELAQTRQNWDKPQVNPDLAINTAPFLTGARDMGELDTRAHLVGRFLASGGSFVSSTEERQAYAKTQLERAMRLLQERPQSEHLQRTALEYMQEYEFGGRWMAANEKNKYIHDGALVSPAELLRIQQGGVKSAVIPNPLASVNTGTAAAGAVTGEVQAVKEFHTAMVGVETSLARVLKTLESLSKVDFDPVTKQLTNLASALLPYAEALKSVQGVLANSQNKKLVNKAGTEPEDADKQAEREGNARRRRLRAAESYYTQQEEDARREGDAYRRRLAAFDRYLAEQGRLDEREGSAFRRRLLAQLRYYEEEERRAVREGNAFRQRLRAAEQYYVGLERDAEREGNAFRARLRAQEKYYDGEDNLRRRRARAEESAYREQDRKDSARSRQELQAIKSKEAEKLLAETLPQMAGLSSMPGTMPMMSQDIDILRQLMVRDFASVGQTQRKLTEQLYLEQAQIAAGISTSGTRTAIAGSGAKFDAQMTMLASNAQVLATKDPRFFGRSTADVLSTTGGILGNTNARRELGDALLVMQKAEARMARIDVELAKIAGEQSPAADQRRQDLQGLRGRLQARRDAQADRLANDLVDPATGNRLRGPLLDPNAPKTLDAVRKKYGEITAELARLYDQMLKVSRQSVESAKEGGDFLDRIVSKFQNLAAYVTAGGVVYTIANSLRTAATEAIALESDLRRIQGVLPSRSAGQAGIIGQGLFSAASEYGVDLRSAVQQGKLFSQTGASAQQTLELTRAALAGQVGAGLDASQTTELLIAVENITNRQVKAFDILDRISRVEARYAVTAQDLSNAIQRAGSLAQQLQPQALGAVDALDLIIGASTTIIERTRVTGEQAATSLRFMISRLAAPEVARALQDRFGVNLAGDTPGELRPLQDILQDISTRYRDLQASGNTVQAQQLLTTFAGARQSNTAAALLADFDKVIRVATESSLAFGDTQERVRLQLDTITARFAQFNTAFVGFAASVLNDTGLAGLIKGVLRLGTSALQTGSTVPGGLALGTGLYGASFLFGGAAKGIMGFAANAGPGFAGTTAVRGASMLGGLASGLSTAGPVLALIAAFEGLAKVINKYLEKEDNRTAESFDKGLFRQSDFYKTYEENVTKYGMTPQGMFEAVRKALLEADASVSADIGAGKVSGSARYNTTLDRLVTKLEEVAPAFASIGDRKEQTSVALGLIKEAARFGMAVPTTYSNELLKDLDNILSTYDKSTDKMGEALRKSVTAQYVSMGTGSVSRIPASLSSFFNAIGLPFLRAENLQAPGVNRSLAEMFQSTPEPKRLSMLDDYARRYLLVDEGQRSRLEAAEASLRKAGREVSSSTVMEQMRTQNANLTASEQTALSSSYFRLGNQRQLAGQIIESLRVPLGDTEGQRLNKLKNDLGQVGTEEGNTFTLAIRQAIEIARKKLVEAEKSGYITAANMDGFTKALDNLNSAVGRASTKANLTVSSFTIRDRMFEPLVGYASQMAEVNTQERLAKQFGMDYDPVSARAQAARQLISGLDQVPIRILQDQIKLGAGIVSGGTGTLQMAIDVAEEGGQVAAAGARGAKVSPSEMLSGLMMGRKDDIARMEAMQKAFVKATTVGYSGFIADAQKLNNPQLNEAAAMLQDALDQLGKLGDPRTSADLKKLAEAEGILEKRRQDAVNIVGDLIKAEVDRANKLAEIARKGDQFRADTQYNFVTQNARLQMQLLGVQADPRRATEAMQLQLQIMDVARDKQLKDAQSAFDQKKQELEQKPDSESRKNDLAANFQTFQNAKRQINTDDQINRMLLLTNTATQLQRQQREEAVQLVSDLTNPIRGFLMSSRNFGREGYQQLGQGIGQAAQQRIVDVFMRRMFSETGLLGNTLANAFQKGGLTTRTAIETAFSNSVTTMLAKMQAAGLITPEQAAAGLSAGDLGKAATSLGGAGVSADGQGTSKLRGVLEAAGPLAGSLIGAEIGPKDRQSGAQMGASMGALFGHMLFPGIGGLVGGLAGGALGSLIGIGEDSTEDRQISALERIERNTRQQIQAIENQTQMLQLDSRFMNVPTGFVVPQFRPFGANTDSGGGNVTMNITINAAEGQDEQRVATLVADAIRNELRGAGNAFDIRR